MSIQDTATKQYVSEAEVFADAFNYLIYDGEQVIKPEQLTDMDTTQYVIPYHEDGRKASRKRRRNTAIRLKRWRLKRMIGTPISCWE